MKKKKYIIDGMSTVVHIEYYNKIEKVKIGGKNE